MQSEHKDDGGPAPLEEVDAYWRLYAFAVGRVLSADDVADIQQVLNDFNDEIGNSANAYHAARQQVLREIGGEELVQAAALADQWQSKVAVDRALAHFYAAAEKYEAKARKDTSHAE